MLDPEDWIDPVLPEQGCDVRPTGIPITGDVPWGRHFCQFLQDEQDLIDILVPYFKTGLENNEYCMWFTPEPLGAEGAKRSRYATAGARWRFALQNRLSAKRLDAAFMAGPTTDNRDIEIR